MNIKINKICSCGAVWKGTVPNKLAEIILKEWAKSHSGKGHKQCDAKTASKARNRNDNPDFYL